MQDELYIQLLNNRAAACLKTGQFKTAVEDTCIVIDRVTSGDDLKKALLRRANAYEALEKWEAAKNDYTRLMGLEPSKVASDGFSRCNKVLNPEVVVKARPKSPPAVRRKPEVTVVANEAVAALREKEAAAAKEETEKLSVQDDVDAKIAAWKKDKETNLRALLSSLDAVLWPELGLKKANIAELIQPAQVKKCYIRAIGKLHPDKVNISHLQIVFY